MTFVSDILGINHGRMGVRRMVGAFESTDAVLLSRASRSGNLYLHCTGNHNHCRHASIDIRTLLCFLVLASG